MLSPDENEIIELLRHERPVPGEELMAAITGLFSAEGMIAFEGEPLGGARAATAAEWEEEFGLGEFERWHSVISEIILRDHLLPAECCPTCRAYEPGPLTAGCRMCAAYVEAVERCRVAGVPTPGYAARS